MNAQTCLLLVTSCIAVTSADSQINKYSNYYPPIQFRPSSRSNADSQQVLAPRDNRFLEDDEQGNTVGYFNKIVKSIKSYVGQVVDNYYDKRRESKESLVSKFLYFTVMGKELHSFISNLRSGRQLTLTDIAVKAFEQFSNMNKVRQSVSDNIQSYSVSEVLTDSFDVANMIKNDLFPSEIGENNPQSRKVGKRKDSLQKLINVNVSPTERIGTLVTTGRMMAVAGTVSFIIAMAFSVSNLARNSAIIQWDPKLPISLDDLHSILTTPLYMVETVIDQYNGIRGKNDKPYPGVGFMDMGKDYLEIYKNAKLSPECIRYNLCKALKTKSHHNEIFLTLLGFINGDRKISKYMDDVLSTEDNLICNEDVSCSDFLVSKTTTGDY